MKMRTGRIAVLAVCLVLAGSAAEAQQGGAAANQAALAVESPGVVVLDTFGIWRMYSQLAPPVLVSGETVNLSYAWLNYETPGPASGWMEPGFDDQSWLRGPVNLAPKTGLVKRVCLRGKFTVTDPRLIDEKGLELLVVYRGGIIVYVNGKEVRREHIAEGQALAEGPAGEERRLEGLAIPSGLLRKGMNVIGLEVVRAAYPEQMVDGGFKSACEVVSSQLTSSSASGLVPNAVRPNGFQVWNQDPMAVDCNLDFGDEAEPLRPVMIMAARNGMFSGKVMVGSTRLIRGLTAGPAELAGSDGVIPAANVQIRYGEPWGVQALAEPRPYRGWPNRLGALVEQAPEVAGPVVPVWIRVTVPETARAGTYRGSVKIEAEGETAVEVPVEVRVADWTLPDTKDFRTWVDMIQCPDTLSLEYKLPLWSEKHFEMIGHAFKLMGETGARVVYIPLIAHSNLGNEESMVRWVKNGDKYDYDFSIMERYLDLAERNIGKPKLVIFVVWDVYMTPEKDIEGKGGSPRQKQVAEYTKKTAGSLGRGPMVTVVDPATQKTELVTLPTLFNAEASRPLWKPLFDEILARMSKRGLEKDMMLGILCDTWASKEEHQFFKEITGGLPWVIQSHEGFVSQWIHMNAPEAKLVYDISTVGYQARVWTVSFSDDYADRADHSGGGYRVKGGMNSQMGWARPDLVAVFDRETREHHPTVRWLNLVEPMITGSQRGVGRLGADYWKVLKDKRGERKFRSQDRYPESMWWHLSVPEALLAPGPNGPVATDEMEAFREGVQECEARIVIERALADEGSKAKLGENLAGRCEDYLKQRHTMMWLSLSHLQLRGKAAPSGSGANNWRPNPNVAGAAWFLGSGWQQRTAQLYELAGEVNKKLSDQ